MMILYLARSLLESGKNASKSQLDVEKTFESQMDLVIKPIKSKLDLDTYPIGESVMYEMIHQRYRQDTIIRKWGDQG